MPRASRFGTLDSPASTTLRTPGTVAVIDVQGPHTPSWKRGRRSVRDGRGPRDTYG